MEAPDIALWLNQAIRRLANAGVDTPNLDAVLLFCKVAHCTRTQFIARSIHPLDDSRLADLERLLVRREAREPLPHLLGDWEFMGRSYEVGRQALIPRPETELLVEAVVERLGTSGSWGREQVRFTGLTPQPPSLQGKGEPNDAAVRDSGLPSPRGRGAGGEARAPQLPVAGLTPQPPSLQGKGEPDNVAACDSGLPSPRGRGAGGEARDTLHLLDVGTGTGCIAIELALRIPTAQVTSIDASPEALELARRNVARFQVQDRVALRHARFPDDVNDLGPFDAIVSNPPYIPSAEVDRLAPELTRYEPRAALDGGPDGLDLIHALISESRRLLKPGGLLALEIGHDQSESVVGLLQTAGWSEVEGIRDLAGHLRVVLAR